MPCLVFLLSGCEIGQDEKPVQTVPEPGQQLTEAIRDLSGRLGVPPGGIEVVKETSVTWRDGSLGCPKEGMMYTQALVEGTLIVLRVDGKDYAYHSGKGRPPFYCENPEKPLPKSSLD